MGSVEIAACTTKADMSECTVVISGVLMDSICMREAMATVSGAISDKGMSLHGPQWYWFVRSFGTERDFTV